LAIERKFHDVAMPASFLKAPVGAAVVSGGASTYAPLLAPPTQYRSATGNIYTVGPSALNVVGPGDSGSDRDGRQIINDSIHIRGVLESWNGDYAATDIDQTVNIVLVLDTQTNGGAPAGGAVFVNPGDLTAASPGVNGASPFVNLANSKRFRILKHIRRNCRPSVSGNGTVTRATFSLPFSMDIPLKQMKTNYVNDIGTAVGAGAPATVAAIGDNGLFLFAWSVTDDAIYLSYNSRLRFRG